jgi:hypothetical protein
MPQSTDHGIKGNPNDGNDNNASGSGGGGGEEEGGGSEEEGGQIGDVALSNSAPAHIEITPERPVEHLINSPLETTVGCCVFALEIKLPVW